MADYDEEIIPTLDDVLHPGDINAAAVADLTAATDDDDDTILLVIKPESDAIEDSFDDNFDDDFDPHYSAQASETAIAVTDADHDAMHNATTADDARSVASATATTYVATAGNMADDDDFEDELDLLSAHSHADAAWLDELDDDAEPNATAIPPRSPSNTSPSNTSPSYYEVASRYSKPAPPTVTIEPTASDASCDDSSTKSDESDDLADIIVAERFQHNSVQSNAHAQYTNSHTTQPDIEAAPMRDFNVATWGRPVVNFDTQDEAMAAAEQTTTTDANTATVVASVSLTESARAAHEVAPHPPALNVHALVDEITKQLMPEIEWKIRTRLHEILEQRFPDEN